MEVDHDRQYYPPVQTYKPFSKVTSHTYQLSVIYLTHYFTHESISMRSAYLWQISGIRNSNKKIGLIHYLYIYIHYLFFAQFRQTKLNLGSIPIQMLSRFIPLHCNMFIPGIIQVGDDVFVKKAPPPLETAV